jgi:hypothetical protein
VIEERNDRTGDCSVLNIVRIAFPDAEPTFIRFLHQTRGDVWVLGLTGS